MPGNEVDRCMLSKQPRFQSNNIYNQINVCIFQIWSTPAGYEELAGGFSPVRKVGAQPLIWKSFFIVMQIKLIFARKVVYLASF